jgi:hypothetical protein
MLPLESPLSTRSRLSGQSTPGDGDAKMVAILVSDVVGYRPTRRGGRRSHLVAASGTAERSHRSRRPAEQAIIGLTLLEKGTEDGGS